MIVDIQFQPEQRALLDRLTHLRQKQITRFRDRLTTTVLEAVVRQVVARHPVETGRSRDAWQNATQQLSGQAAGNPTDGTARRFHDQDRTTAEVTNDVDYVVYLENGTTKMPPHHMVARSMAEAPVLIMQWADTLFREELVST